MRPLRTSCAPTQRWFGSRAETAGRPSPPCRPRPSSPAWPFIATGAAFLDALAGGTAAGLVDAPILLVAPDQLPQATAEELSRLVPTQITVLGGPSAVSDRLVQELADRYLGGALPLRLEGSSATRRLRRSPVRPGASRP